MTKNPRLQALGVGKTYDGVLALDRATGLDPFCYREEWNKHHGEDARYSAKQARSKDFQAIMPLRGKILNTWEVDSQHVLSNQEVHDIAVAIGVDPGSDDLSGLQPLYQAVAHGCRAGLEQEACDQVYWDRIGRGKEASAGAARGDGE